jgi:hypothetical protein
MTQFTCKGVKQINNRISLNMTFTFTIRISQRFSSAREFQMGNFQKYWSQNVGQDVIVLDFFHGRKILKVDGRDPQNREKNAPARRSTCMKCPLGTGPWWPLYMNDIALMHVHWLWGGRWICLLFIGLVFFVIAQWTLPNIILIRDIDMFSTYVPISANCLFVYCLLHLCIRMFIVFLCNINHCNDSAPCWDLDWTIKSYLILSMQLLSYQ